MAKNKKQVPAMSPAPATSIEDVTEALEDAAINETDEANDSAEENAESEAPVADELPRDEEQPFDQPDVVVNPDLPRDPNASIASALVAISRIYNDAEHVGAALTKHMVKNDDQELHAVLQRMKVALGDFCHSFTQIEQQMSDRVRDAIVDAIT